MDQLYLNSKGFVTGFEETRFEPHRWIALNSTVDKIPKEKVKKINAFNSFRASSYDAPDGFFSASNVDWTVTPEWHFLSVHWHAWIPVPPPDTNTEELVWYFSRNLNCEIHESPSGRFMLGAESTEMSIDLKVVDSHIAAIQSSKRYAGTDNPFPTPFPQDDFYAEYETPDLVMDLVARARRAMVDKLGYLNWWMACAPSMHGRLLREDIQQCESLGFPHWPKRGILVNLARDWQQLNFPSLIRHDVPIFYPWTAAEHNDKRFARLDPAVLAAYHSFHEGDVEMRSDELPLWTSNFPQLSQFSRHLESLRSPELTGTEVNDLRPLDYFIIDRQGWRRRPIKHKGDIAKYDEAYNSYESETLVSRIKVFHRWSPRSLKNRMKRAEATPNEDDQDGAVSLGSEDDEDDAVADPDDLDEITEIYKGSYAPRIGEVIDRASGNVVETQARTYADSHRDYERQAEKGKASTGAGKKKLEDRIVGVAVNREPKRMEVVIIDSASDASRDSYRAKTRSISEWSQDVAKARTGPSIPTPANRPATATTRLTFAQQTAALEASARGRVRYIASIKEWGERMTYKNDVYRIPPEYEWNMRLVNKSYLIIDSASSRVRFRYWAATEPHLTRYSILTKAVEHGIRFALAVRQKDLTSLRPALLSELESKTPHGINYTEPALKYGRGGIALREAYVAHAEVVANRSNAGAFIAMGGPTSWLARKYSKGTAVRKFLAGPSAVVTWHNVSNNDSSDNDALHIVWEAATPSQVDALCGYVGVGEHDSDRWFYPPEDIFREKCKWWSGEWNAECDNIFTNIAREVDGPFPKARTRGDWHGYFRKANRPPDVEPPVRIEDDFFIAAELSLQNAFGASWHKKQILHLVTQEKYLPTDNAD